MSGPTVSKDKHMLQNCST